MYEGIEKDIELIIHKVDNQLYTPKFATEQIIKLLKMSSNVVTCKKCLKVFRPTNGNAKYCNECGKYRNAIKAKNYRERKKQEKINL